MRIALVGQPNCGKSALFNTAGGPDTKSLIVSNFSGATTVDFVASQVNLNGDSFTLVDLPGIISVCPLSEREEIPGSPVPHQGESRIS